MPDGRTDGHAEQVKQRDGFENGGGIVRTREREVSTDAHHRGDRGKVYDDRSRIDAFERMEPEHGHTRERGGGQCREHARIRGFQVRLFDQRDARDSHEYRQPHLPPRRLPIEWPRNQGDPDRKGIRESQYIGHG